MIKKLRIFVVLFILAFSFSVKAEVILEVDCDNNEISSDKNVICEGTLLYEQEGINDIEFSYQTNLDVKFSNVSGFTTTNKDGKVLIHTDNALYDKIMNATKIFEFTLSLTDNIGDKEPIVINNIKINKSNDILVDGWNSEFNVTKEEIKLDNVCTLDSITIEKELVKNFDKNVFIYRDIEVTNEVIFIDAVRTSNKSSATGLGNVKVPKGEQIERDIVVTAEDGTKNIYKLFITNITPKEVVEEVKEELTSEIVKNTDNTLKLLELYDGKERIDIDFNSKKEIYNIEISNQTVDKLTIKAVLNNEKASFVKNYGPRDIKISYGYNKELIKVLSENGDERIITLNINYLDNRDKDNTLKSLTINGETVDLTKDILEIKLPNKTLKTIIEAIPNSEKSLVNYEDVELLLGDNMVKIEVTSESGETKEYDVNIVRDYEKILLENITVQGYNLNFDKSKNTYDLEISSDTDELDITITPNDVRYEILNNNDLKNESKVIIKVTDDDGLHEYTINILKDNLIINIICYLIFGIGVISLVASIIYYVKRKQS